jgi:hypothetical protein
LLLRQSRPLTAHDEVIDTEKLPIPCDLLLHRRFVADDEPVARDLLLMDRTVEEPEKLIFETSRSARRPAARPIECSIPRMIR